MTRSYPPDDASMDSPLSGEAITPRGGFMARPGLKSPPRHAVVVRGGDAPQTEHIPRFRSSAPPPPPVSEPAPTPASPSVSEKATLRAIPTPVSSKASAPLRSMPPAVESAPAVIESVPPPSDAPLSDAPYVSSVSGTAQGPESQRPGRSRWTIVAAAAAGLVLGLATVAARVYAPSAAVQPSPAATLSAPATARSVAPPSTSSVAAPRTPASATPESELSSSQRKPTHAAPPSVKRSIF